MTQAEVYKILGGPPGDYATDLVAPPPTDNRYADFDYWLGDDGLIFVLFDEDGLVRETAFEKVLKFKKPTFLQRVWDWLFRQSPR
jgi:hypothetical protein